MAEWKKRGIYFYIHNKELRESYNTWKVIENLSKSGFKEQVSDTTIINKTYLVDKVKKKGIF